MYGLRRMVPVVVCAVSAVVVCSYQALLSSAACRLCQTVWDRHDVVTKTLHLCWTVNQVETVCRACSKRRGQRGCDNHPTSQQDHVVIETAKVNDVDRHHRDPAICVIRVRCFWIVKASVANLDVFRPSRVKYCVEDVGYDHDRVVRTGHCRRIAARYVHLDCVPDFLGRHMGNACHERAIEKLSDPDYDEDDRNGLDVDGLDGGQKSDLVRIGHHMAAVRPAVTIGRWSHSDHCVDGQGWEYYRVVVAKATHDTIRAARR